jgi:hypothetical protein
VELQFIIWSDIWSQSERKVADETSAEVNPEWNNLPYKSHWNSDLVLQSEKHWKQLYLLKPHGFRIPTFPDIVSSFTRIKMSKKIIFQCLPRKVGIRSPLKAASYVKTTVSSESLLPKDPNTSAVYSSVQRSSESEGVRLWCDDPVRANYTTWGKSCPSATCQLISSGCRCHGDTLARNHLKHSTAQTQSHLTENYTSVRKANWLMLYQWINQYLIHILKKMRSTCILNQWCL